MKILLDILKSIAVILLFSLLLVFTWAFTNYHRGVFPVPQVREPSSSKGAAVWIPKNQNGINQLVLSGSPYEMGLGAGEKTKDIIYAQEKELVSKLRGFFPNSLLRRALEVIAIRWFWGIEKYFEPWMVEEMYGVSKWTSDEFDYLGDRLTRQVAYHGLHEVGQMAVDQKSDDMGCTVVAVPYQKSWIIGRNFDFEGGRIFDSEKIMKWVFPKEGYAFVSVIWAGMVGAVTGVNENGVYISLNAAGSRDFSRYGVPSSLVITKALMGSKTAKEAVEIIKEAPMFITDIFVVSDSVNGDLFRVEKSPTATEVIPLHEASVVTNHLISPRWSTDSINHFRKYELTSLVRAERGEQLVKKLGLKKDIKQLEIGVMGILRDKGEFQGHSLHLGNRRAIDALIATHSVLYNEESNVLFVNEGPGASGAYIGFDLKRSFADRRPVVVGELPADPLVTADKFSEVRQSISEVTRAESFIRKKNCGEAKNILESISQQFNDFYGYFMALGDYHQCMGQIKEAKVDWQKALSMSPAYPSQEHYLLEKLK